MIKQTTIIKRVVITPEQQFEDLCAGEATYIDRDPLSKNIILDGVAQLHTNSQWRVYDYNVRNETIRSDSVDFEVFRENGNVYNLDGAISVRQKIKAELYFNTQYWSQKLQDSKDHRKTLEGKWFNASKLEIADIIIADRLEKFNTAFAEEMKYQCMSYTPTKMTYDTIQILWHLDVYFYENGAV